MSSFLRTLFSRHDADAAAIARINAMRGELASSDENTLREKYASASNVEEVTAIAAIGAERLLGQRMFDVQLRGALALSRGSIAEMQTGEGKTLTAVPAALWFARSAQGVHVMTVNDILPAAMRSGWGQSIGRSASRAAASARG